MIQTQKRWNGYIIFCESILDNSMEENGTSSILTGGGSTLVRKTFLNHVFSTTEESKAEIFNVLQYSGLAILPVVVLNKVIQRFIPEVDPDKSSLEILVEVLLQLIVIFVALVLIHRSITYVPTYSGFKYDSLTLTSTVLTFLVIVLSIQTKLGIKVSILAERVADVWNGTDSRKDEEEGSGSNYRVRQPISSGVPQHRPSQADFMDSPQVQPAIMPPAPVAKASKAVAAASYEPVAANSMLGSSFGTLF
jgi:hypothetical protein